MTIEEVDKKLVKAREMGCEIRFSCPYLDEEPWWYENGVLSRYVWDYYNDEESHDVVKLSDFSHGKITKKGEIALFYDRKKFHYVDSKGHRSLMAGKISFVKKLDAKEL